jgi:hypothetical protein
LSAAVEGALGLIHVNEERGGEAADPSTEGDSGPRRAVINGRVIRKDSDTRDTLRKPPPTLEAYQAVLCEIDTLKALKAKNDAD